MRNLLLKISYDGKYYHGWQIQKNAVTVQEVFQDALKNILGIQPDLKGCSRTDSGVHAYEYCISMKTGAQYSGTKAGSSAESLSAAQHCST